MTEAVVERKRSGGVALTCVFLALAAVLTVAASQGTAYAAVAVAAAAFLLVLVVLATERTAIVVLGLAFGTAPMYRGIESLSGGVGTPTDVLLVIGLALLLPTLIGRRLQAPTPYVVGLGLVLVTGVIAAVVSGAAVGNAFSLAQWIFFLGALPLTIAWWHPPTRVVNGLLWCYLIGHSLSTLTGVAEGPAVSNRYDGLTHHPNAFALAGMMAVAIVLYLFHQYRDVRAHLLLLGIAALSVVSLGLSGSRAATLVAMALVLMVPIVERSAISGVLLALAGAVVVFSIPFLVGHSGEGSTLSRLAGEGTALAADESRLDVLRGGIERYWESPVLGTGLVEIELIHNVFLEVLVATGVVGFVSYLVVIFVLVRPLFTRHPLRRLSYLAWAFVGVSSAVPGLWDRTIWVPMSVVVLAALPAPARAAAPDDNGAAASRPATPAVTR